MPKRIEINENIEIRELTTPKEGQQVGTGKFGLFSTQSNTFLQKDGKVIELEKDDRLVLAQDHTLDKLDLTPKLASGETANRDRLLIVENLGKTVELEGNNLGVVGQATVKVSQFELAGVSDKWLEKGTVRATSRAGSMSDLMEQGVGVPPRMSGRVMSYGDGQNIVAVDIPGYGQFNRIDFVDEKSGDKLLSIIGDTAGEDRGMAKSRVDAMQQLALPKIAEALNNKDTEKSEQLGIPEAAVKELQDQTFSVAKPRIMAPFARNEPSAPPGETEQEKTERLQTLATRDNAQETDEARTTREKTENEARAAFLKKLAEAERIKPDQQSEEKQKSGTVDAPSPDKQVAASQQSMESGEVTQGEVNSYVSNNVLGLPNHAIAAAINQRKNLERAGVVAGENSAPPQAQPTPNKPVQKSNDR